MEREYSQERYRQKVIHYMDSIKTNVISADLASEEINVFMRNFEEIRDEAIWWLENESRSPESANSVDFLVHKLEIEAKLAMRRLPLYKNKNLIIDTARENQCVVVTAETGSGKTTQMPQYFLFNEISNNKLVFITQPRKIAAVSVAKRVQQELDGQGVCYILHKSEINKLNYCGGIVYFTENCFLSYLLIEIKSERFMEICQVLILDEAHERSLEFDVILGLIKQYILPRRPDFRLIITSATVKVDEFSEFLGNCPVIPCSGKCYPVSIHYINSYDNYFNETINVIERVVNGKLIRMKPNTAETLLVFLTGKEELQKGKEILQKNFMKQWNRVEVLTLYGRLSYDDQQDALRGGNHNCIRIVLSTNVAESSLTVPNVSCVIDCGREKVGKYNPAQGLVDISVKNISKTSAIQRTGRAGRVMPGECFRIYTEQEYLEMPDFKDPAILNSNLGIILLKFMKYGISNIYEFPLINKPSAEAIKNSFRDLYLLKAIDYTNKRFVPNSLGEILCGLDIDPLLGKMIYHGGLIMGCSEEATIIGCMMRTCNYFFEKKEPNMYDFMQEIRSKIHDPQVQAPENENFGIIKKFFNTNYLLNTHLSGLGDCMLILFASRQWALIRCMACIYKTSKRNENILYEYESEYREVENHQDNLKIDYEKEFYFSSRQKMNESKRIIDSLKLESDETNIFPTNCKACHLLRTMWAKRFGLFQKGLISGFKLKFEVRRAALREMMRINSAFDADQLRDEKVLASLAAISCLDKYNSIYEEFLRLNASRLPELSNRVIQKYKERYSLIAKVICTGLFRNLAHFRGGPLIDSGYYKIETNEVVLPYPLSYFTEHRRTTPPKYVVFFEINQASSSRSYMKFITPIDLDWANEYNDRYITDTKFSEEKEQISSFIFSNIGPAYIPYLLGNTGNKLADIEKKIHDSGAKGALLLYSQENNSINFMCPNQHFDHGKNLSEIELGLCKKEIINKSTVQVSSGYDGLAFIIAPGAIISDILEFGDSLSYEIKNLKPYSGFDELMQDLKNTFEFQSMTFNTTPDFCNVIVHFRTKKEAETAESNLLKIPLPGADGPITEMRKIGSTLERFYDFGLKVVLPYTVSDLQIEKLLELYNIATWNIKAIRNLKLVFLWFQRAEDADFMLNSFRHSYKKIFKNTNNISIQPLDSGLLIPKEFEKLGIDQLGLFIRDLCYKYNCKLTIKGKDRLRIFGDFKNIQQEAIDKLLNLLHYTPLPISKNIMKLIEKHHFATEDGELNWKRWQESMSVVCSYFWYREILVIYGFPQNRQSAKKFLTEILRTLNSSIVEVERQFNPNDWNYLERFRVKHSRDSDIEIRINRRQHILILRGQQSKVNDLLDKIRAPTIEPRNDLHSCGICTEPINAEDKFSLSLCGHQIHKSCFKVQVKIASENKPLPDLPLKCIYCREVILYSDWVKVLDQAEIKNLYHASLVKFMTNDKGKSFSWCENHVCDFIYNKSKFTNRSPIRNCPECHGKFCVRCKKEVVGMTHEVRCEMQRIGEENKKWIEENTSTCPSCEFKTEKNGGCNHITCPNCNTHYCFICGEDISRMIPVDHYRDPSKIACFGKYLNANDEGVFPIPADWELI
ncbi:unnamed protein product [Blepharisma stoltei]|uniref:RNA helicase n=1 Tax=Blepharisma stoltei TaxID=1481888 RepID=A0AAU9JUR0_9CILI|nr:unnamed protein product [Blepharisma stoltei]